MTTSRDSYAWNYREPAILFTLSESFAEGRFEPLTIGSKLQEYSSFQTVGSKSGHFEAISGCSFHSFPPMSVNADAVKLSM